LKASDITADVAFASGLDVKKSELHGMSQRGGSVTSDIRYGEHIFSPMVPPGEADYLVVLAPDQVEVNIAQLKSGGKLIGTVFHPTNSTDYATYLLQAQQSGADAIAVGSIGLDLSTLLKQAVEFGILPNSKQKLTAFLLAVSDVNAAGLQTTANVYVLSDFYWDQNDETRAFSKAFFAIRNKEPNFTQAANYSGLMAYFTAVKEAGTDDPEKVVAKMREHPMNKFGEQAVLRPDGRVVSDVQLYQVKTPAESKYPWDYMKLIRNLPGDQVFPSMADEDCPLIKK